MLPERFEVSFIHKENLIYKEKKEKSQRERV